MKTESDWLFCSADFSIKASGATTAVGNVTLVRSPSERERWHKMPYEMIEDDNGPPLYVCGYGHTLQEALSNAYAAAARAKDIPGEY